MSWKGLRRSPCHYRQRNVGRSFQRSKDTIWDERLDDHISTDARSSLYIATARQSLVPYFCPITSKQITWHLRSRNVKNEITTVKFFKRFTALVILLSLCFTCSNDFSARKTVLFFNRCVASSSVDISVGHNGIIKYSLCNFSGYV